MAVAAILIMVGAVGLAAQAFDLTARALVATLRETRPVRQD